MGREQELYPVWLENMRGNDAFYAELEEIAADKDEIRDRFYRDLEFGTAGLRGVLGLGTNRMNIYTVRQATQGLAQYLKANHANPTAAIAYDSRINSDVFAREAACVFAANGVKAYLYRELMPTPALSYAVRELHCDAGVVVTASHNPAKYNGYKAYGSDGCQIGLEQANTVMKNISSIDLFHGVRHMDFEDGIAAGMIEYIPDSFVQQYIDRVFAEAINPEVCVGAGLKLVYTPLNGAGNRCVRTILAKAGVTDITVVPEQEHPDGNFPTCPYPNPEMKEALRLGMELCAKTGADLLLATDPDADRVAVAVKAAEGYTILTGNEAGVLLLDYIAKSRMAKGMMPQNPVAVKSIVSTKLADAVAAEYGVELVDVLTGFKFIGEVILGLEQKDEAERYIFGFEESCGYLSGGYVRDKDAINASLLLVEMASAYKLEGKTLLDRLHEIYAKHGIYLNTVASYTFEGADGMAKMAEIMANLRENPSAEIAGCAVTAWTDYMLSLRTVRDRSQPESYPFTSSPVSLPKSDVLEYGLDNKCTIIIRPSGTEPKIKIYCSLVGKTQEEVQALSELYARECAKLIGV